ncbi:hypothetical protein AURDEDRAFT_177509 [Auricularia subglabra TFB-10046 SS5]|uniref:Uncharacterized protein n=1 Tax=Auricularia subglabra (strain TFB-10046 / SS5) TaxID=717982 RepID=J0LAG1_AURST|nr:hypothetical protein AURDEDRAFT_177509 [Auricularia subglabra TFB-10046 SS5]
MSARNVPTIDATQNAGNNLGSRQPAAPQALSHNDGSQPPAGTETTTVWRSTGLSRPMSKKDDKDGLPEDWRRPKAAAQKECASAQDATKNAKFGASLKREAFAGGRASRPQCQQPPQATHSPPSAEKPAQLRKIREHFTAAKESASTSIHAPEPALFAATIPPYTEETLFPKTQGARPKVLLPQAKSHPAGNDDDALSREPDVEAVLKKVESLVSKGLLTEEEAAILAAAHVRHE